MRIALDVDGVLADAILAWIEASNRIRPPLSKAQITSWEFWDDHGIDKHDFYRELSDCWRDWEGIPPTEPDLARSVQEISRHGTVDIVTAREKSTNVYVKKWLERQGIRYSEYVHVEAGPDKAGLGYDLFIDDSPQNAERFAEAGKDFLLYDQPWNAGMTGVRRIRSLSEAPGMIS